MSLEEIQVMKRLSLTRLSLLSVLYSGNELLTARRDMAQTDLSAYINNIKSNLSGIENAFPQYASTLSYNDPYMSVDFKYIYYVSRPGKSYSRTVSNKSETIRLQATDFLKESVLKVIEDNTNDNKIASTFQDYTVATAATVADWEIQLMAHIRAGEGL